MNKNKVDLKKGASQISLNSSLGLLAFGDLAFTAWRKLKTETLKMENEGKK